ncbi:MAG: alpha/beta hydrolase [Myxococcota bacterium]|nr:alpha/beta hydrolase [Myxococcota bacterium]
MTLYLNFRAHPLGGSVVDPYVLRGDDPERMRSVSWAEVPSLVLRKNVLFGVHGFNVSYEAGARTFAELEPKLGLGAVDVFFGVLWPGDYWLPVVNYPFEGGVALDCGKRLAGFCSRWLGQAQSTSFLSHSLGARLVLEAVKNLDGRARNVCLTAAAINRDCLATEYAQASSKADEVSILASRRDVVLQIAFRVGDPISALLHPDHDPFESALGYDGPIVPTPASVAPPWQIQDGADYGHHDYLPPGDTLSPTRPAKWMLPAEFMGNAFRGQRQGWP